LGATHFPGASCAEKRAKIRPAGSASRTDPVILHKVNEK
jgi:hypothetical protein